MKFKLLLLVFSIAFSFSCSAQTFFKPLPKPASAKFGLSLDSIVKSIRPVVVLSATVSDGAQLAGGAGLGYQANKWDAASQSYITQWSLSAVGLIGTTGTKLTGTAALILGVPGTNGLIGLGGGYDLTQGRWVFVPTVQIKFN